MCPSVGVGEVRSCEKSAFRYEWVLCWVAATQCWGSIAHIITKSEEFHPTMHYWTLFPSKSARTLDHFSPPIPSHCWSPGRKKNLLVVNSNIEHLVISLAPDAVLARFRSFSLSLYLCVIPRLVVLPVTRSHVLDTDVAGDDVFQDIEDLGEVLKRREGDIFFLTVCDEI